MLAAVFLVCFIPLLKLSFDEINTLTEKKAEVLLLKQMLKDFILSC